jgi:polysaccharide pyruvyl transferase WcaK-like protein
MMIKNIVILGASLDTGNLGVSALATASIALIRQHWPEAQVCLLGGREFKQEQEKIEGVAVAINVYPVRYCSNLLAKHHIWKLLAVVACRCLLPAGRACEIEHQQKKIQTSTSTEKDTLNALLNADLICDITGGDSFSDIYGMGRFARAYLLKRVCQMTGKPFIMLPQTYGPFKSLLSKWMAQRILHKTQLIYSRDKEGLKAIESLIGKSEKVRLCPDVAFTLKPKTLTSCRLPAFFSQIETEAVGGQLRTGSLPLVGLNVSGLLYNGGYKGKNEFGIQCDYRKLMRDVIDYFISVDKGSVLLVPHVVPEGWKTENDLIACRKLRESLPEAIRERVFVAEPEQGQPFYDQCEIKYLIGQCSFFLGSRMHATIAAISQCIPTVGLAYSKKFAGVYETAGVENCVADLRVLSNENVMSFIKTTYRNKILIKTELEKKISEIKRTVSSMFEGL